jgi:hypothetical protein
MFPGALEKIAIVGRVMQAQTVVSGHDLVSANINAV